MAITRYTFSERVMHALSGVSYLYLLLTGLAFWSPVFYWLAVVLGGGYRSRQLHPWVGLVFTVSVVWMWLAWRRDMRVTPEDRAWRQALGRYVRNEDAQVPPAWRFNYGQKLLFWLMAGGAALLLVSGLGLWFVASVPPTMLWIRDVSILVHVVAALATAGGFIIHVYMGIAVVPGGVSAVVHGTVSDDWARTHHPLWHQQVTGRPSRDAP